MRQHLYTLGQIVSLRPGLFISRFPDRNYEVERLMPARQETGSPQYAVRNVSDRHLRVVTEDQVVGLAALPET